MFSSLLLFGKGRNRADDGPCHASTGSERNSQSLMVCPWNLMNSFGTPIWERHRPTNRPLIFQGRAVGFREFFMFRLSRFRTQQVQSPRTRSRLRLQLGIFFWLKMGGDQFGAMRGKYSNWMFFLPAWHKSIVQIFHTLYKMLNKILEWINLNSHRNGRTDLFELNDFFLNVLSFYFSILFG